MTLMQIERTRKYLSLIDTVHGLNETQKLVEEMRAFYGEDFNVNLKIMRYNTRETYSSDFNDRDKIALKGFLEGCLAKESSFDVICQILDFISEAENLKNSENERYNFIVKLYRAYYGKIAFDKTVEFFATAPKEALEISGYQITQEIINGLIVNLRLYANELSQVGKNAKINTKTNDYKQEINFHPQINVEAKNETNLNLVAIFDNARQQAEDLGLPDEQYSAIMEKISELEELSKSKESKGKRWQKVKEFMKWLVEQGIQVAGVLLPVLAHSIQ